MGCSRATAVIALAVVGSVSVRATARAETPYARAEVLAEVIERFTRFVDWPVAALPPNATFVVCAIGASEVEAPLKKIVKESGIKQHPGVVRATVDGKGCHLLYVGASELARARELLARLHGAPVLTVALSDGAVSTPAVVNLFFEQRRPRFTIDAATAKRSGLDVRSRLLRLAKGSGGRP